MIGNRKQFREWLEANHDIEKECWLELSYGKPADDVHFWYVDAVEEALCFGWVDGKFKIENGRKMRRFTPRRKGGAWSELNKERVRRLEKIGKMTDAGRAVLPDMDTEHFEMDGEVRKALEDEGLMETFLSFPPLYVRVRSYNVAFSRKIGRDEYEKALSHLISETKKGKMYGEWNDYGRLLDY